MKSEINKPIFVVGSPRSGTSILAWCLGHHPNLFPVPESSWMGEFAISVAIAYQIGAARGDYSILSAMEIGNDELFTTFGESINNLILRHRKDLETKRETRSRELKVEASWLEATSTSAGPKERWVDGTPEYSFYICGLRKLFPNALFIHIFRDVHAVVRSMLNFHRVAGIQLVPNEQEAYRYWLRTVSACLEAEQAYGPSVVHRIRYTDLIYSPESTMRSLFGFLKEPFTAKCLEPLAQRINSSEVSPDFKSDDPATDPAIIEAAQRLSAEIENSPQPTESSQAVAYKMEDAFSKRVEYVAALDSAYHTTKSRLESTIAELRQQIEDLRNQLAQAEDHAFK
jgi:Sulfotransferase family